MNGSAAYAILNRTIEGLISGVKSHSVDGLTLHLVFNDDSTADIVFTQPKDGVDGINGLTPHIGRNGNWHIGATDTGVKAAGTDGLDGKNGKDGTDGVDGKDGKDGKDGMNGVGISFITKLSSVGLKDIYQITYTDGKTFQYEVINGSEVVKLSDLVNDTGFITSTVENLVNYYSKEDVYKKTEIDTLLTNIRAGLDVLIVSSLPTEDISQTTIYLVAVEEDENTYSQHMYIAGEWASLGTTHIDLSDYHTKGQIESLLLGYVSTETLSTTLAGYVLRSSLGKTATSNDYNDLDNLPEIPTVPITSISLNGVVVPPDENNNVNLMLQEKTVTPSKEAQTILPDSGSMGFSQITVTSIPYMETINEAGGITVDIAGGD